MEAGGSSSSGEEDGDAAWRAAINSIAGTTTYPNPNAPQERKPRAPHLKHYQLQAQKLLHDMLEETIEIVKEPDPVLNDEDPKINQEEEGREPGIRLFKHVRQPGIVFDHFDEPEPPKKRPRLLPGDDIDEKSKKFKRRVKSVAVEGKDLIAAANDANNKSLAKFEAKVAAAKAKAKREEERVNNLKKIRGERWLPSMANELRR
ncbi:hypothetical protein HN51_062104 [Arachis hypogaea]|uniref:uncharacterized protein LOC107627824 n=1 Tax=Arachis ipaensis TaxID=130454 RepID=UPI0007AFDD5A|nr:uncharacterized protein LOC107627824 [Arachis ipaensis]XP_016186138.1 uncharacterized protein LOC107627824 [Arachis ipaensis]XP_020975181.1 uncharacterized protein LOC107627824 [Arachis ipaensis]XP_025627398.1 uncharacterized protein LOC112720621 [Arachis hypogaea]QHO19452.1 uncharacterized protein DS421_11g329090 [Arachis hypogaea]QHO19453.1 uncharacterized protein DS421_11g329090 [Arachis hypogaea]